MHWKYKVWQFINNVSAICAYLFCIVMKLICTLFIQEQFEFFSNPHYLFSIFHHFEPSWSPGSERKTLNGYQAFGKVIPEFTSCLLFEKDWRPVIKMASAKCHWRWEVCLCDFCLWLLLVIVASAGFSKFSEKVGTSPLII